MKKKSKKYKANRKPISRELTILEKEKIWYHFVSEGKPIHEYAEEYNVSTHIVLKFINKKIKDLKGGS